MAHEIIGNEYWRFKGCINLPHWINDRTQSIQTGSYCLEIYEDENCTVEKNGSKMGYDKIFKESYSHDDLDKIKMGGKISSFKLCKNSQW